MRRNFPRSRWLTAAVGAAAVFLLYLAVTVYLTSTQYPAPTPTPGATPTPVCQHVGESCGALCGQIPCCAENLVCSQGQCMKIRLTAGTQTPTRTPPRVASP